MDDQGVDGKTVLKCNFKKLEYGQGSVAGCCEHGNEPLTSINLGNLSILLGSQGLYTVEF